MNVRKIFNYTLITLLLILNGFLIVIFSIAPLRSQVQEIAGLAVAASSTRWNNIKDASVGDAQTSGLMANGPYLYDSVNARFDRWRGDTSRGAWVNMATSTTISTNQVSVDSTAGGTVIKSANLSRRSIVIRNIGTVDMFIGASGLTTTTGFSVRAGESISLDRNTAAIYGITASSSTTVGYLEE